MSWPREDLEKAVSAVAKFGTRAKAAEELGIAPRTLYDRLKAAATVGLSGFDPVQPGFEISRISTSTNSKTGAVQTSVTQRPEQGPQFEIPEGMAYAGGTYHVGPDGRIKQHWPRDRPLHTPQDIAAEIKSGLLDIRGLAHFVAAPKICNEDIKTCYFIADAHLGQLSWDQEVGVNYDLAIAEEQLCAAFDESIARAPDSDVALIAILGDFCHADDDTAETPAHKNKVDVDGRHGKTRRVASRILRYMIDRAREKHSRVIFRYIPGNHDPKSAGWLSHGMWLLYDGEDYRVSVDDSQSPFGFYEFGVTMIGLFHGHTCKPEKFRDITVSHQSEMWGRTKKRYGHSGHIHQRKVIADECGGMIIETHQAITAQDGYAHANFSLSGRSIDTVVYSRFSGEYNRFTVPIEDRGRNQ
jgi:hypothetical protein